MKQVRNLFILTLMAVFAVVLQACGKAPPPEDSCNFVQNSQSQRVSWGDNLPVVLYVDSSVPGPYYARLENAAAHWNKIKGKELVKIGGWSNGSGGPARDGSNVIYWMNTWEADRAFEQARTTIYWTDKRIYEADIRINAKDFSYSWDETARPSKVDFESLMVHEMGHVLGLAHQQIAESVMVKTLPSDYLRRVPQKPDVNSITCEY